jgi:hypothetical protein
VIGWLIIRPLRRFEKQKEKRPEAIELNFATIAAIRDATGARRQAFI